MKKRFKINIVLAVVFFAGCATGASDLNLKDIPKDNGIFFGHVDFYNGEDKIDGSSMYKRCYVTFENSGGDTVARIAMDESSWIFSSAPAGRIYLSSVLCNAGFLKSHPQIDTKELFFDVALPNPTYFGHLEIRFSYHGIMLIGGLIGAAADAAASSGSIDGTMIKVDDKLEEAKSEYGKRYNNGTSPVTVIESVIKQPVSK